MKHAMIRAGILFCLMLGQNVSQADEQDLAKRVAALEKRVAALENQIAADKPAGAATKADLLEELQKKARERIQKDSYYYTQQQLKRIEELYREADKDWNSGTALNNFDTLLDSFPKVNRTGCALVQLAKTSKGADRAELLKMAFSSYADCWFANGVQVGPYARFLLGLQYYEDGKREKAAEQFDVIRKKHPTAVDHRGRLLLDAIPAD